MDNSIQIKNLILNEWNNTDVPFSIHKTIHQLFEERVEIQPKHIALATLHKSYTYVELNNKVNQVARQLISIGVKPNSFIGILLPRSPEMIVALLALLKNGAAYVPLNRYDPFERILKIAQTANLEYIITCDDHIDSFSISDKKIILIDQLMIDSDKLSSQSLNTTVSPENTAYIIFTSGTTGTPKGVLVKHKPVINLIEWVNSTFSVNNTDKLIWTTNLSFDLSVYDIFGILAAGGTIRILNDEERMDPEVQLKIILHENITFWDSAPQNLQRVMPFLSEYKDKITETTLRLVFLSGDWIPLLLPDEIKSVFKKAQVIGLGGATEATIWSNYFIINQINPGWKSIPYGKPIQNAKYYILDSYLEHCHILSPGDLYIGGQCLASGYFNDHELTNKKFIDDPYNQGGKLYFTGDKAQWMPDGNIEFLGREDMQVKIRGYRVELGEVKQAVLSLNSIKDCVIVPDKADVQNIQIFLFYIATTHTEINKTVIKNELNKVLPDYMIPAAYFEIDSFPMTSNGKIDNKALMEIVRNSKQKPDDLENLSLNTEEITNTEQKVFNIWREVLKSNNFTIHDNFFEIGGNSLLTIFMTTKVENIFSVKLNIRDFFSSPKIKDLAELIDIKLKSMNLTDDSSIKMTEGEI